MGIVYYTDKNVKYKHSRPNSHINRSTLTGAII